VGAYLAQKWNLPAPLVEIIRCHHAPEQASTGPGGPLAGDAAPSLAVVRLADALSRLVEGGELPEGYSARIDEALWAEAGYAEPPAAGFRDRAREEIGRGLAFLSA
jgi:hypothetical protein